jgi:hypothetical protein
MNQSTTPAVKAAQRFTQALVDGRFDVAHALLTDELGALETIESLQTDTNTMLASWIEGEPKTVDIDPEFVLASWPTRAASDVAHVYVSILGTQHVEAVTVIVERRNRALRIRDLTFGRP